MKLVAGGGERSKCLTAFASANFFLQCVRVVCGFLCVYAVNVQIVAGFLQAWICEWHHNIESVNAGIEHCVAGFAASKLGPL